jgi:hypothetical protein
MISRLFAVIALMLVAGGAQAQTVSAWNAVAATCVPSATSVRNYRNFGATSVGHIGARTGKLVFTCGIDHFTVPGTDWRLHLAYRDSTGTRPAASVIARLYRVRTNNSPTPILIATANSNTSAATGSSVVISAFTHDFNFSTDSYFVQVSVTRSARTQIARFYSAWIEAL